MAELDTRHKNKKGNQCHEKEQRHINPDPCGGRDGTSWRDSGPRIEL